MRLLSIAVLLLGPSLVGAAVTDSAANGFTVTHEITTSALPAKVWTTLTENVDAWWHPDHTFSGDAANLSIDATPLGCFCERLDDGGSVVHLTVTFIQRGEMLRLTGGLGPLGLMGVDGNMTISVIPANGGTILKLVYTVGGYSPDGLDNIAGAVDGVLGEQMKRLASFAETGRPVP
ncbi:MAG: ATPase [Pseudomonadota bacterium]